MSKNKLYTLILLACFAGYAWLFISEYLVYTMPESNFTVCVFKNVTGYPCPSCGTTRATNYFFRGDLLQSILLNPFGIIVAISMIIAPVWIITDFYRKKNAFYDFYLKIEKVIQQKPIAILLIILVIANWMWNFYKKL
jgi:hypothetical protein